MVLCVWKYVELTRSEASANSGSHKASRRMKPGGFICGAGQVPSPLRGRTGAESCEWERVPGGSPFIRDTWRINGDCCKNSVYRVMISLV